MINQTFVDLSLVNNFYQNSDERIRDKFLMSSPVYIVSLTAFYVVITNVLLKFMKNNPKYVINTKPFIVVLYIYYSIMSGYILTKLVKYMIWSNFNFRCMAVDRSWKPEVLEVCKVDWQKIKILNIWYWF